MPDLNLGRTTSNGGPVIHRRSCRYWRAAAARGKAYPWNFADQFDTRRDVGIYVRGSASWLHACQVCRPFEDDES